MYGWNFRALSRHLTWVKYLWEIMTGIPKIKQQEAFHRHRAYYSEELIAVERMKTVELKMRSTNQRNSKSLGD